MLPEVPIRPLQSKDCASSPAVLTDRWRLEHRNNVEGCMAPDSFRTMSLIVLYMD